MLFRSVIGAVFYALSYLLLSVIQTGVQLFFVYSVMLSLSLTMLGILPAQVLVARWFPEKTSVPISIAATGMSFGGIVIPPLVAFLVIELGGWRGASRASTASPMTAPAPVRTSPWSCCCTRRAG